MQNKGSETCQFENYLFFLKFYCKYVLILNTILQEAFTGVDRLFIIPPGMEYAADIVNEAAEIAKEADVKHVILLSAPSGGVPPGYKHNPNKGSFYVIEKKVRHGNF